MYGKSQITIILDFVLFLVVKWDIYELFIQVKYKTRSQ